jgi:hypothetical protein
MNTISEQNIEERTMFLDMINEITSGIGGNNVDENKIGDCLKYFLPKLKDDEPSELNCIIYSSGLSRLLE